MSGLQYECPCGTWRWQCTLRWVDGEQGRSSHLIAAMMVWRNAERWQIESAIYSGVLGTYKSETRWEFWA